MGYRIQREVAAWAAVAALLFQVFLLYGLAAGPGAGCPEALHEADHHHDPGLANSYGRDWAPRHHHTGGSSSCRLRVDLVNAPPFAVVDAPALPPVALHWAAFVADWMASAPSTDGFSRPHPRAPPSA